jgi:hypothetical protein
MKFSELIDHAVECIKTYNDVIKTLDSHGDEYVKKVSSKPAPVCGKARTRKFVSPLTPQLFRSI